MVKQIDYNLEDHNRKVVEQESHLFQPEVLFECPVLFYLVLNLNILVLVSSSCSFFFLRFWLFYLLRDLWEQTEVTIPCCQFIICTMLVIGIIHRWGSINTLNGQVVNVSKTVEEERQLGSKHYCFLILVREEVEKYVRILQELKHNFIIQL